MSKFRDILNKTKGELSKKKEFDWGIEEAEATEDFGGAGDVPAFIPTGLTLLDLRIGGGLPLGRFSEVFSEQESVGKSTLAQTVMAQVQRIGGLAILIEQETAFDAERAKVLGVNLEDLIRWSPPSVEDGFEFIGKFLDNCGEDPELAAIPKVIVWDTIAGSATRAEAAGDTFGDGIMKRPRVVSEAHRRYKDALQKYHAHFMWVNQSYSQISARSHVPLYETPGGKAIKFYASTRLRLRRKGMLGAGKAKKAGEEVQGILTHVEAVKNKLSAPFRPVTLALYGPTGYDDVMSLAHFYLEEGHKEMISGTGRYTLVGYDKSVYWKDIPQVVAENPAIYQAWREYAFQLFPLREDRIVDPADGWVKPRKLVEAAAKPKKKGTKKA